MKRFFKRLCRAFAAAIDFVSDAIAIVSMMVEWQREEEGEWYGK